MTPLYTLPMLRADSDRALKESWWRRYQKSCIAKGLTPLSRNAVKLTTMLLATGFLLMTQRYA